MNSFTSFALFGTILQSIESKDDRAAFALAIMEYGHMGIEPELDYPLNVFFETVRDDIDNSVRSRQHNKGGRPKNQPYQYEDNDGSADSETPCSDDVETPGFDDGKPPVSESEEPPVSEVEEPLLNKPKPRLKPSKENITSDSTKPSVPYGAIIDHLNEKAGTSFRASAAKSRQHINGRWREGHRLEDFIAVIDEKCRQWLKSPEMRKYLRPETLFGTKFEGYLMETRMKGGGRDLSKYDFQV